MLLLFYSCIDPINVQLENAPERLVMDGFISNLPGPYRVSLSKSFSESTAIDTRISGATKVINDSEGFQEELVEEEQGVYYTIAMGIQGIICRSYWLNITTSSGIQYKTIPETILNPVPIKEFYWENVTKEIIRTTGSTGVEEGVEFYLDVDNPAENRNYFLWDYLGTYLVRSPNASLGSDVRTCYVNDLPVEYLNIKETVSVTGNSFVKHPIIFLITYNFKFELRYSMLVRQMILEENAYKFWDDVLKVTTNVGSIFDPPPFQISGNVVNLSNPIDITLGYFWAAGIAEKRLFINRSEVSSGIFTISESCQVDTPPAGPPPPPPPFCFDCTKLNNSSNQKPDFWE